MTTDTPPDHRATPWLGRALAVGAAAAAVWAVLVRPVHQELAAARNALRSAGADAAELASHRGELERLEANLFEVRARALHTLGPAWADDDRAGVYDAFSGLAERCGVRIDRIEPSPARGAGTGSAAVSASRCTVEIVGPYDRVLDFLDELERSMGLARVVGVKLTASEPSPGSSAGPVRAVVESEHLRLDPDQPARRWLSSQLKPESSAPGEP